MACVFFLFKQKTAYEMRISDWSSDVCSSDLPPGYRVSRSIPGRKGSPRKLGTLSNRWRHVAKLLSHPSISSIIVPASAAKGGGAVSVSVAPADIAIALSHPPLAPPSQRSRSEEHTSELQSLIRISYAVY